jgi:hypothetical protein
MRLVTRADFDGLVCGALITKFEKIDSYLFVEPKFMQDGLVEVRHGDIIQTARFGSTITSPTRRRTSTVLSYRARAAFDSRPARPGSFASIIPRQQRPMMMERRA